MPKWAKVVASAALNGVITFGTAYLALLQNLPADAPNAKIGGVALAIAAVGAALTFAKDVQAYLTNPPQ